MRITPHNLKMNGRSFLGMPVYFIGLVLIILVSWWFVGKEVNIAQAGIPFQSELVGKSVSRVASDIPFVTRIKLTPDSRMMFATTLDGRVLIFSKMGREYLQQTEPLYAFETGYDFINGGDENGLTGLIVSNHYATNHNIFLLYAQKERGVGRSRILRLTIERNEKGDWTGTQPQVIFTGNVNANGAHQIQGGESLDIEGVPHLLFSIGESYVPSYARQVSREAGKIMLIQETGEDPLGVRPYPAHPRIQAIGIRNVYGLSVVPGTDWVYMTDNGPDANDTILYAPILDGTKQFDFHWGGNPEFLLQPLVNGVVTPELVIYHWEITVSPVDVVAIDAKHAVVNIFSSARKPEKELGEISLGTGGWEWKVLARANPIDFGGNLLGLARDMQGRLYFSDFVDGLYRLS